MMILPAQPAWLNTTAYPFGSKYFDTNGHRMHYIDEGSGPVLLFVHGTPSWSYEYRHLVAALRDSFRCIAVDHIGFGLSDKPKAYDYRTQAHSQRLESFITALGLTGITLVVHDFGGPIALNVAIKHPERFSRLVVLNSWLWSAENDLDYRKLRRVLRSPLLPFLYKRLNFSPRYILPRSFGEKPLDKHHRRQYTKPFSTPAQRNGPLAFAHSLLNDQAWFEGLWEQRSRLNGLPMLIVWGMKDPVLKPVQFERWQDGFPGARVVRLDGAGHFPQEEEPDAVASAIRQFLR